MLDDKGRGHYFCTLIYVLLKCPQFIVSTSGACVNSWCIYSTTESQSTLETLKSPLNEERQNFPKGECSGGLGLEKLDRYSDGQVRGRPFQFNFSFLPAYIDGARVGRCSQEVIVDHAGADHLG